MNRIIHFVVILILFCSCGQGQENPKEIISQKKSIPENAIPFEYIKDHIYIKGNIDGKPGRFIFDTGADQFYFDSVFFSNHAFSYERVAQATVPGAGNSVQRVRLILDTLSFISGERNYKTTQVPILKIKPILGDYVDGIIGRRFFSGEILEVNYEDGYLMVLDSISFDIDKSYSKIKVSDVRNRIKVPVSVKIDESLEISGDLTLDIGSGGSLSITSTIAKRYDLSQKIANKRKGLNKHGGIGGESGHFVFKSNSIKIGDFALNDMYMDYSFDKSGALASGDHFGLLGNVILKRFNLIIDFENEYIYLKPNSKFQEPDLISRLGFKYVDRSQTLKCWNINGFYEDSPAQKSGLMVDDRITHINGVSVLDIDYKQQDTMFRKLDKLTLTVSRKGQAHEFEFVLEDIL